MHLPLYINGAWEAIKDIDNGNNYIWKPEMNKEPSQNIIIGSDFYYSVNVSNMQNVGGV